MIYMKNIQDLVVHARHTSRKVRLSHGSRIIGGSETTIQDYPYQVFLLMKKQGDKDVYTVSCGGSIANERCVITAAHCLTGMDAALIRAGSTDSSSGGTFYPANTLKRHPKYDSKTLDYDIGVIKLSNPIKIDGTNTAKVDLSTSDCPVPPGTNLTITGWGITSEGGDSSKILKQVSITSVSLDDCRKKSYTFLSDRMICAGVPEGGRSACNGDSGSPLVLTGTRTQVGLASFGIGCAQPNIPGVYSNLCAPDVHEWLKEMECA
ncbi:trypsin-2-like [Battus philenor]|uniref:trypsin-2-like n=1 Tax=Battus philenor TaxID=42288 RepID=UPI0035CEC275